MRQILFYGMPHPAVRAVYRYVAAIIEAAGGTLAGDLVTDADRLPPPDTRAIHIRSEAIDALDLAAHNDWTDEAGRPLRLTFAARLDAAWRDLPRLSIEAAMTNESYAVAFLAEQAGVSMSVTALAAARAGFRALVADPAPGLNPLGYLAMLAPAVALASEDPDPVANAGERLRKLGFVWRGGAAAIEAGEAPTMLLTALGQRSVRTILLLSPDPSAAVRALAPHLPARIVLAVASGEGAELTGEGPRAFLHAPWNDTLPDLTDGGIDLIHLHHVEGWAWLDRLLPWARAQLPRQGLITGMEPSAEALAAVVSRLTGEGRGDGISFALGERQWRAVPHGWWSA